MGVKTSVMKVISPRVWGYEKVDIIFGRVRRSENQDVVIAGDFIRGSDGRIWEFVSRKDDTIQGRPVQST
jgi:hypothetical protein|tara:strand:- start:5536 stop:5745 length:210 start_codon:yes stop_codon:yes gene_type:complete